MARFEGQVWKIDNTNTYFVVYFAGNAVDGWVERNYEPTKPEVQTLWFQRISGSPDWWEKPPPSFRWFRTDLWNR